MAGLAAGRFQAPPGADRDFFEKHLAPWIGRFFADLEAAQAADFYRRVGTVGRLFIADRKRSLYAGRLSAASGDGTEERNEDGRGERKQISRETGIAAPARRPARARHRRRRARWPPRLPLVEPAAAQGVSDDEKRKARYQANSADVQNYYRVNRYPK